MMRPIDLIIALDCSTQTQALDWVNRLNTVRKGLIYKIGLELFTASGPSVVEAVHRSGARVFLDLKLHDIPQTVANATARAAQLQVAFLTLHAQGGARMIQCARQVVDQMQAPTRLLAVTALTSFSEIEWQDQSGNTESLSQAVTRLAQLAWQAGAHGWVSSAHELASLSQIAGASQAYRMVPGIRLLGGPSHDQRRVMTPQEAVRAGACGLVVGRAVLQAPDPEQTLAEICAQVY